MLGKVGVKVLILVAGRSGSSAQQRFRPKLNYKNPKKKNETTQERG